MKKLFSIIFVGLCLFMTSCDDTFNLDLQEDPNNPTPETADLESLYNSVQLEFAAFLESPQFFTMQLSRQRAFTAGNVYETAYSPVGFDGTWRSAYSNFMPDADAVIDLASATQQFIHVGSSKVMKAYVLATLVDLFGDVPFTNAGQGIDLLSPSADNGADVYASASALLDEAIADLEANTAAGPNIDVMYGGSASGWIAAANSLKIKMAVNTGDMATVNAIVDSGNYISSSDQDWDLQYGSNRDNPDSRHPLYVDSYETSDGDYQSNWLMWLMSEDVDDPRRRAYFYRQVPSVPLDNINRFDCIHSVLPDQASAPSHYTACNPDMPYCAGSVDKGYYGRDHGNGNGIPPDGDIRAVYGVYPAGGKFDNDTFGGTQNSGTDGALGAGIHPIISSFMINFWRAELMAASGNNDGAKEQFMAGVAGSISKSLGFIDRDQNSLTEVVSTDIQTGAQILGDAFVPSDSIVSLFLDEMSARYDAASDKMQLIATQELIASYGNGIEGLNMIRRTGQPDNIQPAILTSAGTMVRSALYPAVHVNLNQTATQKSVYDQVFWDQANLGPCFN